MVFHVASRTMIQHTCSVGSLTCYHNVYCYVVGISVDLVSETREVTDMEVDFGIDIDGTGSKVGITTLLISWYAVTFCVFTRWFLT